MTLFYIFFAGIKTATSDFWKGIKPIFNVIMVVKQQSSKIKLL